MCGGIKEWQVEKQVDVRLTTDGRLQVVNLGDKYKDVEEVRLHEIQFVNFNAGVSGSAYVDLRQQNLHSASVNNESQAGTLVMVDVLNPHSIYQRPRTLAEGNLATISSFQISILMPNGAAATFTEATLNLTIVCRKAPEAMESYRRMKAQADYPPSYGDRAVQNTYPGKN